MTEYIWMDFLKIRLVDVQEKVLMIKGDLLSIVNVTFIFFISGPLSAHPFA
jgi:hypothetical protein